MVILTFAGVEWHQHDAAAAALQQGGVVGRAGEIDVLIRLSQRLGPEELRRLDRPQSSAVHRRHHAPVCARAFQSIGDRQAGNGAVCLLESAQAGLEDAPGEEGPGAVVHGDDGGVLRHLQQPGAHGVVALPATLRDQQRLGLVQDHELRGEAHGVRRMEDTHHAGYLGHVQQPAHGVRDDGLAAEQEELLGFAVRQAHADALSGGRHDCPHRRCAVPCHAFSRLLDGAPSRNTVRTVECRLCVRSFDGTAASPWPPSNVVSTSAHLTAR